MQFHLPSEAIRTGDAQIVKLLLQAGANISSFEFSLKIAIERDYFEIVKLISERVNKGSLGTYLNAALYGEFSIGELRSGAYWRGAH